MNGHFAGSTENDRVLPQPGAKVFQVIISFEQVQAFGFACRKKEGERQPIEMSAQRTNQVEKTRKTKKKENKSNFDRHIFYSTVRLLTWLILFLVNVDFDGLFWLTGLSVIEQPLTATTSAGLVSFRLLCRSTNVKLLSFYKKLLIIKQKYYLQGSDQTVRRSGFVDDERLRAATLTQIAKVSRVVCLALNGFACGQ